MPDICSYFLLILVAFARQIDVKELLTNCTTDAKNQLRETALTVRSYDFLDLENTLLMKKQPIQRYRSCNGHNAFCRTVFPGRKLVWKVVTTTCHIERYTEIFQLKDYGPKILNIVGTSRICDKMFQAHSKVNLHERTDGSDPRTNSPCGAIHAASNSPTEYSLGDGLVYVLLDEPTTSAALSEMVSLLNTHGSKFGKKKKGRRDLAEIGWSFRAALKGERILERSLSDYPALTALIKKSMRLLVEKDDLHLEKLNVMVQRYHIGEGVPPHIDLSAAGHNPNITWFEEPVYGCVLRKTSPQGLYFVNWEGEKQDEQTFQLDEQPGLVFLQRGNSRYVWRHAMQPLTEGERISVTWRWFVHPGHA